MDVLKTERLSYSVQGIDLCKEMDIEVEEGLFTGIIGPNGSGKSTLLKQLYGVLKPMEGVVFLYGTNLKNYSSRDRAKTMGVLAQENSTNFPFNVEEVATMGRSVYHSWFQRECAEDKKVINESLKKVGMEKKKKQLYSTLSGGEKQRVLLARALSQEAKLLILDEPTNHLDIGHQWQIMEFLKTLNLTIFSAIHDLNLAACFCDRLILISQGHVIAKGTPKEVLTQEVLREIFQVRANVRDEEGRLKIEVLSFAKK